MRALLGWLALWIGSAAAPPAVRPAIVLSIGRPIEQSISGGESHAYVVALSRGDLLHAVVDQRGIDVVEEVFDPEGRRVLRVDCARGAYGPEPIWLIAERRGPYRIVVASLFPKARGSYVIRLEDVRPGTPRDRLRAEAARLSAQSRNFEELTNARARQESLAKLTRAATIWAQTQDPRDEALVRLDIGRAHQFHGEFREAMESVRRADALAAAASDPQLRAKALFTLALCFSFTGDTGPALDTFERSAALAREARDPQQESAALHGQAYCRWNAGEYQQALGLDRRSLSIARSLEDSETAAWALWGLGLTDISLGELDRSIQESNESIALWHELGNSHGESVTLQNLGFAYWLTDRKPEARETYRRALPVMRAVGDKQGEALALSNLGLAETDLGDPSAAVRTLEESVLLWRAIGSKHGEALALRNLGYAFHRLGRSEEAIARYARSRDVARSGGDPATEANALASLAQLESQRGDLDAARDDMESALAIVESQRGGLAESRLRSSFLSAHQDYYAVALDIQLSLHDRAPGQGHLADAFRVSEQGRARALAEGIAEARLDLAAELPEDLKRREKDLGAELDRLQKELAQASDPAAAEANLRKAEESWEGLVAEMRRRVPRYAAIRYPDPVSSEEARALLDSSTALVSYALGPDRPVVFVLTASGLEAYRLAVSKDDLRERVENFVGLIGSDSRDRWGALSNALYADLVAPWRESLPPSVEKLVIVPDGVLHSLPFEALARPATRRLLVEDFAVSYAPSATVLAELAEGPGPSEGSDMLVLADPRITPAALRSPGGVENERYDVSALPDAASEAAEIVRFGDPASELDVGSRASEARIKGRSLERFRVLHFATHTLISPRVPSRSALLLAAEGGHEGLLTTREIYRLKLKADLVVLSACQTARGRILAGEGVQSLAHAFFHAGGRSLVASLWDVSDRRTARLMTSFYRHLAAGSTKAEALREAKLEMIRENPNLAPRYWAPFVLIGEPGGRIPLREPLRLSLWAAALGVVAVGGAIWTLGRRQRRARSKGKGPSFSAPAAVSTSTVQK